MKLLFPLEMCRPQMYWLFLERRLWRIPGMSVFVFLNVKKNSIKQCITFRHVTAEFVSDSNCGIFQVCLIYAELVFLPLFCLEIVQYSCNTFFSGVCRQSLCWSIAWQLWRFQYCAQLYFYFFFEKFILYVWIFAPKCKM